jgi:glycerol dehydrogenase
MTKRPQPYAPIEYFARADGAPPPRVFGAPQRYIQGDGVLDRVGHYLSGLGFTHAGVLMSARSRGAEGRRILSSLDAAAIRSTLGRFGGECSRQEIELHVDALRSEDDPVDCFLAVGGGKSVDAGKSIAHRLGIPLVVIPTLASNDAPCSAVSVLYTPEGVGDGVEFFPHNPIMVVVDTGLVAAAAERYLVSGMGDAVATWYEARACNNNPDCVAVVGGRPTLAGLALAELCASTIYADGLAAARACRDSVVTEALERIVEANTLLSGLGFESGGLAAAHAVAHACTVVASVRDAYLHGEMVAIGTLVQLSLEHDVDEGGRVAEFFAAVGLPVHLGQLGLAPDQDEAIRAIVEDTVRSPIVANMPFEVSAAAVHRAVLDAHRLGSAVATSAGDAAYRRLHG